MTGSEDACKLPGVSAQTDYEIVWQVYGGTTACSKGTHGGEKERREQARFGQWWRWSDLQGLFYICSIARKILRDV